ncbi:Calmodulin-binding protein [Quillaja saponaria]|uniref:Calmodulin-binding protein n=1 Tax=Quillaja saponaria TaxID=32244 RepID=A0AAD7M1Z6_QUISA|nr:Calmodulin-binding protein [Quillaja saponaria]
MQTRYMERSNTMAREKRGLDSTSAEGQPDRKRPALASVIVEALKVDSLQKLCSSLEPVLRRVVSEEVERALAKLGPAKLTGRSSPKCIEGPDGRNLQLHFKNRLSLPLFTGGKVEGEQGAAIHVILIDASTGRVVTSGPESSVKLDVVVLEGDFNNDDDDNWTQEEFESHVVKEREGKRPLLTGDLQVTLKEGVGTLGELMFTDNSSWIRSRKFRLGLKVSSGHCDGIHIREGKTEAFTVKDHRGELYKKHYPPALSDEVWRLEKIGKDGSFHKRLNKAGIYTVEDFLRLVVRDSPRLRNILGSGMSNKMWDVLVEHAKTCVLSADSLSDSQKVYVDTLVKKAYDNWMHVVEYDGKSLLNHTDHRSSGRIGTSQPEVTVREHDYSNSFNQQFVLPSLPVPVPSEQPSIDSSLPAGGYNQRNENRLSLGPPQSSISGFQNVNVSSTTYRGLEDFFPEEEIRMRSHEMLENEDMQHLLRIFNMGGNGHASFNTPEDAYLYSSTYVATPSMSYNFDDERNRSSGKAVVGWLKLKAALRWGIFIRKQAAEKRAQLVELDDS